MPAVEEGIRVQAVCGLQQGRIGQDWKRITQGPVCCGEGSSPGFCHRVAKSLKLRQKDQPGSLSRGY